MRAEARRQQLERASANIALEPTRLVASDFVARATVDSAEGFESAFEAARFAIDTLKQTVPIWKQEHWDGGTDWSDAAHDVRPVRELRLT